jgi:tRNA pseudouridine38-40 synthase
MRVQAVVAYDGTAYSGFQRQTNAPSVQETLEDGLAQVTRQPTRILGAGRTDAGVHALGQVIAFDTDWRHGLEDLQRALNAVLPDDVAVRDVELAQDRFHPRFDAASRCYRYTVHNSSVRCPLMRLYSLQVPGPLDAGAMERVAQLLLGEHDFAAFGRPTQGDVTVRRVLSARWEVAGAWLTFDIEANAFLYRMVRSIVGTMLQVGQGKVNSRQFADIMQSGDRGLAGPVVPPHGLCLIEVKY